MGPAGLQSVKSCHTTSCKAAELGQKMSAQHPDEEDQIKLQGKFMLLNLLFWSHLRTE